MSRPTTSYNRIAAARADIDRLIDAYGDLCSSRGWAEEHEGSSGVSETAEQVATARVALDAAIDRLVRIVGGLVLPTADAHRRTVAVLRQDAIEHLL